ncbi:class I SAM-dependent methyltransferase [Chryseolinea lacunae]|uniref:Class I SAM-dependent methyltransferase n=1 Tax=Chryseolinea lacunae TaxID=2801331 RepID=A0ABS1KRR8_9BACT|nr:class I SAM-dependent methyltransferase [Chryseolinea lacunae]MBL0742165.1 class I SAM-dependent methyltransferase [Chryseolinea lacunae]
MSARNFDRIAPLYDALARRIYGETIREAQAFFLPLISPSAKVLILGGGTGWVLAELLKMRPDLTVCYVEASSEMLRLTRARFQRGEDGGVLYIHGTEDAIPADAKFDVVITAFYFDLFPPDGLRVAIEKIHRAMQPEGLWLASDFVRNRVLWQRVLLWSMYRFFRWLCGIEAGSLPPWETLMTAMGMKKDQEQYFFRRFIKSISYRTPGS